MNFDYTVFLTVVAAGCFLIVMYLLCLLFMSFCAAVSITRWQYSINRKQGWRKPALREIVWGVFRNWPDGMRSITLLGFTLTSAFGQWNGIGDWTAKDRK